MINLCYPYVTKSMKDAVGETLGTRFIGQGPKVDEFEQQFQSQLDTLPAVAVGSGTDALHLAYILSDIKPGDEVLVPVFTCTATNIPLLWMGAKIVFVDIDPKTLNISVEDLARKITKNTKVVVTVDYAGMPCNYSEIAKICDDYGALLIQDAAHSIGATYNDNPVGSFASFTTFSFQAIKHVTTGDGGMITMQPEDVEKAKRVRWFGIDRAKKLANMGHWTGDVTEVGYKYQMTDIAASMGIQSLKTLPAQIARRKNMVKMYEQRLADVPGIQLLEGMPNATSSYWLMTILTDKRDELRTYLFDRGIESSPLHYRNDQYTIFKQFKNECPNMDSVADRILCIPLHMNLTNDDITTVINSIHNFYE